MSHFNVHSHGGQVDIARSFLENRIKTNNPALGDTKSNLKKEMQNISISDFSSNINFLAPPVGLLYRLQREILGIRMYPPSWPENLNKKIALHHRCSLFEEFLVGNGSMHLIHEIGNWFKNQSSIYEKKSITIHSTDSIAPSIVCADLDFSGYENLANSISLPLLKIPLSAFSWSLASLTATLEKRQSSQVASSDRLPKPCTIDNTCPSLSDPQNYCYHTLVFLSHPHNPTGRLLPWTRMQMLKLSQKYPQVFFVIDESYIDFIISSSSFIDLKKNNQTEGDTNDSEKNNAKLEIPVNFAVLRSVTKFYGIPGLRLGYMRAHRSLIQKLKISLPDWSIPSLTIEAGTFLFERDREQIEKEALEWRRTFYHLRGTMYRTCRQFGIATVLHSECNYLLILWKDAHDLFHKLLEEYGVLIRIFPKHRNLFRLSIQSAKENAKILRILKNLIVVGPPKNFGKSRNVKIPKKTPALMIGGTASDVGKSILVSALGRIFSDDGISVAPFKAQNMSLESTVTSDGFEIATSQAVQALACRISPDPRMNPVLLKPSYQGNSQEYSSEPSSFNSLEKLDSSVPSNLEENFKEGSHVILSGKAYGFYSISEYQILKRKLFGLVKRHYRSLSHMHDLILLEGAGSVSEINLKETDLVNMRMARFAEAKVLLTGDIERGGVFASFAGSMAMLEHWEREMIAGFLINKFRGNLNLMKNAGEIIWESCGRPLLGIIPFFSDITLPHEDSLSVDNQIKRDENRYFYYQQRSKFYDATDQKGKQKVFYKKSSHPEKILRIGVIRLKHMAQCSDFLALQSEPDVQLSFLRMDNLAKLANLSMLILPGSRNTQADLVELQKHSFGKILVKLISETGCCVWGICGGYQMMGQTITDLFGIEGKSCIQGMKIFNFHTTFAQKKIVRKRKAYHPDSQSNLDVYEIHHGQSCVPKNAMPIIWEKKEATKRKTGLVYQHHSHAFFGGYVHGVFDNDQFRHFFLNQLREKKKWQPVENRPIFKMEDNLSLLAKRIRPHINLPKIYQILNL